MVVIVRIMTIVLVGVMIVRDDLMLLLLLWL